MTIAIIPARMASSRFPGKPLAKINGVPMIGHCYFRTKMSTSLDGVFIATCDEEIREYADRIGAPCVMTSKSHERASDRIAEAMIKIEKKNNTVHEIVVLVQGDEPMVYPEMVDAAVQAVLEDPNVKVVNGMADILEQNEFLDPNEVKVVVNKNSEALYFSRAPIPSGSKWSGSIPMKKQVCIIPFRRRFLLEYINLPQATLEIIESVDMLRVLESGEKVKMVDMHYRTLSVDTPEDLKRVEAMMEADLLSKEYVTS